MFHTFSYSGVIKRTDNVWTASGAVVVMSVFVPHMSIMLALRLTCMQANYAHKLYIVWYQYVGDQ